MNISRTLSRNQVLELADEFALKLFSRPSGHGFVPTWFEQMETSDFKVVPLLKGKVEFDIFSKLTSRKPGMHGTSCCKEYILIFSFVSVEYGGYLDKIVVGQHDTKKKPYFVEDVIKEWTPTTKMAVTNMRYTEYYEEE